MIDGTLMLQVNLPVGTLTTVRLIPGVHSKKAIIVNYQPFCNSVIQCKIKDCS